MVDMFFFRDPEEIEKEQEAAAFGDDNGEFNAELATAEWNVEGSAAEGVAGIAATADWNAQTASSDWADDAAATAPSSWEA
jgi:small subunit ribosomal protein SAe